ncbi:hypothetical protein HPB50_029431 [Hyalomma asiaticum]|nr:hypothetical protein HPB50_029431 [Hyalomma asiaticum]
MLTGQQFLHEWVYEAIRNAWVPHSALDASRFSQENFISSEPRRKVSKNLHQPLDATRAVAAAAAAAHSPLETSTSFPPLEASDGQDNRRDRSRSCTRPAPKIPLSSSQSQWISLPRTSTEIPFNPTSPFKIPFV